MSKALEIREMLLPQMFVNSFDVMVFETDSDTRKYLDGCVESPDSCLVGYEIKAVLHGASKGIFKITFQFETSEITWTKEGAYTFGIQGTLGTYTLGNPAVGYQTIVGNTSILPTSSVVPNV